MGEPNPAVIDAPLDCVFCRGVLPSSSTPPSFWGAGFASLGAVTSDECASGVATVSKSFGTAQNSSAFAGQEAAHAGPKISELNEWAQKKGKRLQWNVSEARTGGSYFSASVSIVIDGDETITCKGAGPSKKAAKHAAANAAFYQLFPRVTKEETKELPNREMRAATAHSCSSLEQAVGQIEGSSLIPRVLFACPAQSLVRDLLPIQLCFSDSENKTVEARLVLLRMKASRDNSPPTTQQKAHDPPTAPIVQRSARLIDSLDQKFKAMEKAAWGKGKTQGTTDDQNEEPTLPRDLPFVARLDGRSFSSRFKNGALVNGSGGTFRRPYDQRLHGAFCAAAADCLEQFPTAVVAYTQSDEITLIFLPTAPVVRANSDRSEHEREEQQKNHPFQGRVGKLVSLLAATVSVSFNRHLANMCVAEATSETASKTDGADPCDQQCSARPEALPFQNRISDMIFTFDCRVFPVASEAEAVECCLWRCVDARRNSVSMLFHHWKAMERRRCDVRDSETFSGMGTEAMLRVLAWRAGMSWLDTPDAFRHGSWVVPASRTCRANSSGGVLAGVFQLPEVMLPVSDTLVNMVLRSTVY